MKLINFIGIRDWLIQVATKVCFPGGASGKNLPASAGDRKWRFHPWAGKITWRRKWQPTAVLLSGKPMDRGAWWATYSLWGPKESDTTEVT